MVNIRPAVKIESGAKSALDPNHPVVIRPYVADDLVDMDLSVANVTTVVAERTFWDKAVILHGLRQWFDKRGALRGGGQSRFGHRLRASRPDVLQQPRSQFGDSGPRFLHAIAKC